uniref:Autophagy-related protein 13 N-terminal domain-containing protein n=1 Tax=Ananas comosus var. bracteatus TaxID=296719 RepID=A0A6V7QNX0_ANACO|nr:unnamed protein product [Ananas comosus var. bracteatus]
MTPEYASYSPSLMPCSAPIRDLPDSHGPANRIEPDHIPVPRQNPPRDPRRADPHLHDAAARGGGAAAPRHRRRDRWFQLALGDPPPPIEHGGLLPHGVLEPLVVDIVLSPRDASASAAAAEPVVERWTAQCESAPPAPADAASSSFVVRRTYKKSIILLRSLYSLLRLLPAYRFFRMMCASHQSYNYDLSYRVSSFAAPFSREEEKGFALHSFAPVETQFGNLLVSVQYRPTLADFNLEVSSLSPPMLIADYVGSPATDPMRAFPASPAERGGARRGRRPPRRRCSSARTAGRARRFRTTPSASAARRRSLSRTRDCRCRRATIPVCRASKRRHRR